MMMGRKFRATKPNNSFTDNVLRYLEVSYLTEPLDLDFNGKCWWYLIIIMENKNTTFFFLPDVKTIVVESQNYCHFYKTF